MCVNELKVRIAYCDEGGWSYYDTIRYEYKKALEVLDDVIRMHDLPPYSSVQYDVIDYTSSLSMGVFRFLDRDGEIIPDYCLMTEFFKNHNI